jgi:hypothetical protein
MVVSALLIGGMTGVLLSGAFLYLEVGKYAAPQVPRSLFDERKEIASYVVGIFLGIPVALPLLLLYASMSGAFLLSVLYEIAIIVVVIELAQWLALRTRYFGAGPARPFYALGFRAGIAATLILAIVVQYANSSPITPGGILLTGAQSVALISLGVAGALLSLRSVAADGRASGGPARGALFGGVGIFLVALGWLFGPWVGIAGAALAIAGALVVYDRLRAAVLDRIRLPEPSPGAASAAAPPPPRYGRLNE